MARRTDDDTDLERSGEDAREAADERGTAEAADVVESELAALREQVLRAQADYQNLRRRTQHDYEAGLRRTLRPLIDELLLVLDFLELALSSPTTNDESRNLAAGVRMTQAKLVQALEAIDVRPIALGERFDPLLAEATETRAEPGAAPGTVLAVTRKGYTWKEQVLRPAQVVVAASGAPAEED